MGAVCGDGEIWDRASVVLALVDRTLLTQSACRVVVEQRLIESLFAGRTESAPLIQLLQRWFRTRTGTSTGAIRPPPPLSSSEPKASHNTYPSNPRAMTVRRSSFMPGPSLIRSLAGMNRGVVAVASCQALWRHLPWPEARCLCEAVQAVNGCLCTAWLNAPIACQWHSWICSERVISARVISALMS